jgi:type I site-specific restriction-modification system R (restriction) subunit
VSPEISERAFEEAIECGLLAFGPDACSGDPTTLHEDKLPFGSSPAGNYRKRQPTDYDRTLCLLSRDVVDFILATQPKEWARLAEHHGAAVKEQFLARVASEIQQRGALDVLRTGLKDSGVKFRLAYFRPASGLNDETRRLHEGNLFSIVRQVKYSLSNENCLDLVLFLNGIPETQTARTFERPEYRFLIVANKFQTGFDQPLLDTMYVDKKLGGVNAVQTLSRLNRIHPAKKGTMVLDFANESDEIKAAFQPYYETTVLSEATDPHLLYEIQTRLAAFPIYTEADVNAFAAVFFDRKATQDRLYAVLAPLVDRAKALSEQERSDFRGHLTDYTRLYVFLSQVLTFGDADLEKLYVFARSLRRLLPADRTELPREVQQDIDMESYRIQQTGSGTIALERRPGTVDPIGSKGPYTPPPEELESLSRIIAELNDRFGLSLGPEHRVTLGQMMDTLDDDAALDAAARVNTRENVRLTFDQKVEHVIQDIVDSNFDLYKRITDDNAFGRAIKDFLFDQYLRAHRNAEELIKRGESKTLEFKSTLRWSLKEDKQDDKFVSHAALKTIAAFLNTEGGDLLICVADDGLVVGIDQDRLETDDKFMRHLSQIVRNGLGDRAGTCIDPKIQLVEGKSVCVVSCQRSPEPVFLKWKGVETAPEGDFYVRSGPGTVKLPPESAAEFIRTRFTQPT